jgi:F0F1-type ATP synthase membrane subunit b/b'
VPRHKSNSSKRIEKPEVYPTNLEGNPEQDIQNELNEAQKDLNEEITNKFGKEINKSQIDPVEKNSNTKDVRNVQPRTAQTPNKQFSTRLANLFVKINSTFGHAKKLILEAYDLAIQENHTPQEAKQLLLDNITEFKKTQIYAYLPSECKNSVKQKAGSVSHKAEVSVPKSEQNTELEQTFSVGPSISQVAEADKHHAKLQLENTTLKREIENISNNVIPEALLKKDRQIGELQREKEKLEQVFKKEIQQLKSRALNGSSASSSVEKKVSTPEPQQMKKQVTELTKKLSPKVYYHNLPLIGDVTLPIQVHIYSENDECYLEIDKEVARKVFVSICKDLGQN